VISTNAVQFAPANLAATLTTASIAAAGTGTFTLLKIMTATKLKLALSVLVVAGATTAFVYQQQTQNKLRADNESLTQQLAQLQNDNQSLSNSLAAAGDSKSLSDEQLNELLKLRGEVALLRQQKNVLPKAVQSETNSLPDAKIIQIHLRTQFVSLPSEALQALGVAWMPDAQGIKTGFLAGQQFKVINEAFQGASDVNVMSTPQVVTINGEQAEISATRAYPVFPVGDTNENASVNYTNIGVYLNVRPYFSTNSSTFNLNLNAKLTQLYGDPSQPDVQTIQITNQVTLSPGQTVVMETEMPSGGWLLDSTNVPDSKNLPAGPRSLLMFVTPTVVDSDFMKPLHQQSRLPNPPPPNQ
jgi:cell division protein FtsL